MLDTSKQNAAPAETYEFEKCKNTSFLVYVKRIKIYIII